MAKIGDCLVIHTDKHGRPTQESMSLDKAMKLKVGIDEGAIGYAVHAEIFIKIADTSSK